nr:right-handed parallel beta-helix repeat-containing protein [Streptomyces sp. 846.5]
MTSARGRGVPYALGAALLLAVGSGCADLPHYSPLRTYYVSPGGNDSASGTSPGTAWRSLTRAQGARLHPGDRLLLQGGARFTGTLSLVAGEAGRAGRPVVIGSYGAGRASVESTGDGIAVHNTAGVEIRDLVLTGKGPGYDSGSGVNLYADLPDGSKLDHVTVSDVDISGFVVGIAIGAAGGGTGFKDVTVRQAELHGNRDDGLLAYGPAFDAAHPAYAHQSIDLDGVRAHDNPGDPADVARPTGSGIVLGSVSGATLRGSSVYGNGARSAAGAKQGPVGMWAYDSTGVLIEHDSAYRNHTGSGLDGSGFGLDNNVSKSTLQYDLAFHNDGPGFYAYSKAANGAYADNTIRYDVSDNDGRKLPRHGGLTVYGTDLHNLQIYRNTVVMTGTNGVGPALLVRSGETGVTVRDNILATDGSPVVSSAALTTRQLDLQGNDYFAPSGQWSVIWGGRSYSDLGSWRSASGQESSGGRPAGRTTDPCFAGGALPDIQSTGDAHLVVPRCPAAGP